MYSIILLTIFHEYQNKNDKIFTRFVRPFFHFIILANAINNYYYIIYFQSLKDTLQQVTKDPNEPNFYPNPLYPDQVLFYY